jgi:hypothetical protein
MKAGGTLKGRRKGCHLNAAQILIHRIIIDGLVTCTFIKLWSCFCNWTQWIQDFVSAKPICTIGR